MSVPPIFWRSFAQTVSSGPLIEAFMTPLCLSSQLGLGLGLGLGVGLGLDSAVP